MFWDILIVQNHTVFSHTKKSQMRKPWLSIIWFAVWGLFQTYAVFSVITGSWKRPEAFPEEAYNSLIYPDMFFIPLYLSTSILLFRENRLGYICGLFAGGAVVYAMIYLFALSGLKGMKNLIFDGLFLTINMLAIFQIAKRIYGNTSANNSVSA